MDNKYSIVAKAFLAAFVILAFCEQLLAEEWYASPSGSGDGTIGNPFALSEADGSASIQPGDTLYLRGGTYTGSFTFTISGSSGSAITVRSYPGEWAVIDRNAASGANTITVTGTYITFRDFEIKNSNATRNTEAGRPTGINVLAQGTKVINLLIHDNGNGIGIWGEAPDSEVTGCLIWNNGWYRVDRPDGTGHGIYIQNDTGTRLVRNNVIVNNFGYGIHGYGNNGLLNNMTFRYNVSVNNGAYPVTLSTVRSPNFLVGGSYAITNLVVHTNYCHHLTSGNVNSEFGLNLIDGMYSNDNLEYIGNYSIGGGAHTFLYWTNIVMSGCVFYSTGGNIKHTPGPGASGYSWDYNTYYMGGSFVLNDVSRSFAQWKTETGYDANSTLTSPGSIGTPTWVKVHANPDTPTKGYVVIWNWGNLDNVDVDFSTIVNSGDSYTVKNAQDYFGSIIASGIYAGGNVSFPMTNLVAAIPVGIGSATDQTGPRFNVFTVESEGVHKAISTTLRVRNLKGR